MGTKENKQELMQELEKDLIKFNKSPLYGYRVENNYFPVVGEGSLMAKIMFIGEAPGKKEALTGKPFCGASGKMLDKLLDSINLNREDVYITNIVKDRPPENRDPTSEEIELYGPFLDRQIEIIKPKVVATLGRFAMEYIMRKFGLDSQILTIGKMHGREFETKVSYGKVRIIPLYHPAVAIYNANNKVELIRDFQILKNL
jgi:DNA polymerase